MYPYLGDFAAGSSIFVPFHTFNSSGASVTLTGLAVTDIEVYKGASMTQRAREPFDPMNLPQVGHGDNHIVEAAEPPKEIPA